MPGEHRLDQVGAPLLLPALAGPITASHHMVSQGGNPDDRSALGTAGDVGAELLALIYQHPHEDQYRLVYADWLLGRGDPRGELIMLQFKRASHGLSAAEAARERELLHQHAHEWLGPLAAVVDKKSMIFRKGFLAECSAHFGPYEQRRELLTLPSWATVERLSANTANAYTYRSLRSLRSIGPDRFEVAALLQRWRERPMVHITEARLTVSRGVYTQGVKSLETVFPNLCRLELWYGDSYTEESMDMHPSTYRVLLDSAVGARLEYLALCHRRMLPYPQWHSVTEPRPNLAAWLAHLEGRERLANMRLEPSYGWSFTLVRDNAGWALELDWNTAAATGDLRGLTLPLTGLAQPAFTRIVARIGPLQRPRHERALRHALERFGPVEVSARAA